MKEKPDTKRMLTRRRFFADSIGALVLPLRIAAPPEIAAVTLVRA